LFVYFLNLNYFLKSGAKVGGLVYLMTRAVKLILKDIKRVTYDDKISYTLLFKSVAKLKRASLYKNHPFVITST